MNIITIRGAITSPENSIFSILDNTKELLNEIEVANNIDKNNVISIIFTCTADLDKVYPAEAARSLGYTNASLMCLNEMYVENSLKKCIRIMLSYKSELNQNSVKHIYMKGAKILRPDLLI